MDGKNGNGNGGGVLPAALRSGEMAPRKRFALVCDCGNNELAAVGPYSDHELTGPASGAGDAGPQGPELGLRWVLTCPRCGEQLRLYQTSGAWRRRRDALRAAGLEALDSLEAFANAAPIFGRLGVARLSGRANLRAALEEILAEMDAAQPGTPRE